MGKHSKNKHKKKAAYAGLLLRGSDSGSGLLYSPFWTMVPLTRLLSDSYASARVGSQREIECCYGVATGCVDTAPSLMCRMAWQDSAKMPIAWVGQLSQLVVGLLKVDMCQMISHALCAIITDCTCRQSPKPKCQTF